MARAFKPPTRAAVSIAALLAGQESGTRAAARRGALLAKVFAAFERLPPSIVRHAEPISLRAGLLRLVVDEPVWVTELGFLRAEMIERLNRAVGAQVVKDIQLRHGRLSRPRRPEAPARREPPALSASAQAEVERCAAEVRDPETRAALERAMRWALGSKRR